MRRRGKPYPCALNLFEGAEARLQDAQALAAACCGPALTPAEKVMEPCAYVLTLCEGAKARLQDATALAACFGPALTPAEKVLRHLRVRNVTCRLCLLDLRALDQPKISFLINSLNVPLQQAGGQHWMSRLRGLDELF